MVLLRRSMLKLFKSELENSEYIIYVKSLNKFLVYTSLCPN